MVTEETSLVVIPTYNEALNIEGLVEDIWHFLPALSILVVDDNSSDGTSDIIKRLQKTHQNLHLISRPEKMGLGTAYLTAFQWALQRDFAAVIEMDADFSHSPSVLPEMIKQLNHHPSVIGSRYVNGGGTENWSWFRKLISRGGSLYARLILGVPVRDLTGGFNGWRREVLQKIELGSIKSEGYSFQIELKFRSFKSGFISKEIPILFSERRQGQSKMSGKIVLEALYKVWSFRLFKFSYES